MFVCEDPIKGERRCKEDTTMSMTLRPGEALVWRWGHLTPPKYMWTSMQPDYPDTVCNGLWEYRPDFSQDLWKKGAAKVENIASRTGGPDARRTARPARSSGRCAAPMSSWAEAGGGRQRGQVRRLCWTASMAGRGQEPGQVLCDRRPSRVTSINSAASSPAGPTSSDWR